MLLLFTRCGEVKVTRHAVDRWRQRTGRTLPQLVEALATDSRPTKQQLRRIKKRSGWRPKRILECEHAYFLIQNRNVVTVYNKQPREQYDA
ncbi:hypothetical protein [Shewanella khirikhana]|uniref:Uncharacterized protein n=1 Tax=Shewanella khirikhana TaxID=1965282 RepID=A0A3Q9E4Q3_9GAMM|nr:hypothetical protein [Shewanella khirikhana]AZQ10133.1 hypothetical protein STH12_00997 [Shewanella khirikhana]